VLVAWSAEQTKTNGTQSLVDHWACEDLVLVGKVDIMPKPHPEEFRSDVVAPARKREILWTQIAKDFGISEARYTTG